MQKIIISFLFTILIAQYAKSQNLNKVLGDNYFEHLAYSKAIKHYEKALKKDSSDVYLLSHLAICYKNSGDFKKAEELFKNLLEKNNATSMKEYACLLIYNSKYDEADKVISKFNLNLPAYNRGFIDNILSLEPDYKISPTKINSKYSDFRPCFYRKNLIFTSARDTSKNEYERNGQPYLSLFRATIYKDGSLKYVRPFTEIDTRYHISSFQYVRSFRKAFFTMNNSDNKNVINDATSEINLGIYESKTTKGQWQSPKPVKTITSSEYSSAHPFFSPLNDRLYFSSNRPGGYGGSDIYYVEVYTEGTSEPVNCGAAVNTAGDESFPFVMSDGVLYFSSDGHKGLGGLDIFSAKINDDSFTDVKNLGTPINSSRDDFSFIYNEEQGFGYISSNRKGGVGDDDIYLIKKIIKKPKTTEVAAADSTVKIKEVVAVADSIKNKSNSAKLPVSGVSSSVTPRTTATGVATPGVTKSRKSELEGLISNKNLTISGVSSIMNIINKDSDASIRNLLKNKKFNLDIKFDFDSWEINPNSAKELNKLSDFMIKNKKLVVEINTHTDCRGNNKYNKALSQTRADAVLKYILKKGVSIRRIEAIGYGEMKPLNKCVDGVNCPEEMHEKNRRVEIIIKSY